MKYTIGADISTLYDLEQENIKFYDEGKQDDLIKILKNNGFNSIRLRLWVDPFENGVSYGAGTCDLSRTLSLAKRVKKEKMSFLLDLHYSDFWTDPAKQFEPKAWKNLTFEQTLQAIKKYSFETISAFKKENCEPDIIQVGNEITFGMLWDKGKITFHENKAEGFDNLCQILRSAICGIKMVTSCPLILHLERSYDNVYYRIFFDEMVKNNVEFDAIGFSYYPYWHKTFEHLLFNMRDMYARYRKPLYIVETSYAFTTEHFDKKSKPLVVDENFDKSVLPYPLSKSGQVEFFTRLIELVKGVDGFLGLYYWEPAWCPSPLGTWASEGARRYMGVEHLDGGNEWANQCLFDYDGNALPALKVFKTLNE